MAELNVDKMAKEVAEKAMDYYLYRGKTIREWIAIIAKNAWVPVSERLPGGRRGRMKQIVISVPDEWLKGTQPNLYDVIGAVMNGTVLPEHHSDLIERSSLNIDNLDCAYDSNFELDFGRLYTLDVVKMIEKAPTIIPATKEAEELECDWVDCKHNDKGKCLNESVLNESCYDCYQPVTKEGAE